MSNIQTGGPAFPSVFDHERGMTLRDYFAAKMMQSIIMSPLNESDDYDVDARFAYLAADAMLRARQE